MFVVVFKVLLLYIQGSYADIASYMIMTQCSLDDLNSRLAKTVNEYYFRPNIMVKGTTIPFEEDEWDWMKIGDDAVLRSFKPCTRYITYLNRIIKRNYYL